MLVNLRDICAIAEQNNMAIPQFNTPSLEAVRAAIDAAEQTGYPVIIAHAEGHEPIVPLSVIGPIMITLAERSSALVCVHLDHCEHLSYMRRALELGFTGAMFDGSMLPYNDNISNSSRAAEMVTGFNCGLECELGSMGTRENGSGHVNDHISETIYTDPKQAVDFIKSTGLDILACSFGTVHGIYKGKPNLNFDILRKIRDEIETPLVMHGGSGVSDDDYQRAVNAGIRKVNYFTYGVKYAGEAAAKAIEHLRIEDANSEIYWQDLTIPAYRCMLKDFKHVIKVLANGASPLA
ncbi:class II fructose-bisphosphate aldolase [Alkalibaculum bacchi]|jgi:fructose-bisphosphate aldolase class II|uniref:class II fructose-bisphosphate aldolase n=1 Tax=Alkalibaculum bacchi TaxID=645887 RepID=UPI0026F2CB18|nr:class II fructose-bisphosphate aldolase [Alkalibaculum bacchi]MCI1934027.1 class II fructose-bisphosphate aldolase [Atopobiaceae bacterium]